MDLTSFDLVLRVASGETVTQAEALRILHNHADRDDVHLSGAAAHPAIKTMSEFILLFVATQQNVLQSRSQRHFKQQLRLFPLLNADYLFDQSIDCLIETAFKEGPVM